MLFTVQYPIADLRAFTPAVPARTPRPAWPLAIPDEEFIRNFGGVKKRPRGGLIGEAGEGTYCDASGSFKFTAKSLGVIKLQSSKDLIFRSAFRRFYSDGLTVSKVEVGISIGKRLRYKFAADDWTELLKRFATQEISIHAAAPKTPLHLINAGPQIALSLQRATSCNATSQQAGSLNLQAGRPIVFIECIEQDLPPHFPYFHRETQIVGTRFRLIALSKFIDRGPNVPVFILASPKKNIAPGDFIKAREARLALLRIHAQHECLRIVLDNIQRERLQPGSKTKESDALQLFLLESLRKLEKAQQLAIPTLGTRPIENIQSAMYAVGENIGAELIQTIANLNIRKQIFSRISNYITNLSISMDTFNISHSQVGAAGSNAQASNITFTQNNQSCENLAELAQELKKLREAIQAQISSPAAAVALGKIAEAEIAAEEKKPQGVMGALQSAGKWALEKATELALPLAADALRRALGLP